jgi:hypothetical protein
MSQESILRMIEERSQTAAECVRLNTGLKYNFELSDFVRNEDGTWATVKISVNSSVPNVEPSENSN